MAQVWYGLKMKNKDWPLRWHGKELWFSKMSGCTLFATPNRDRLNQLKLRFKHEHGIESKEFVAWMLAD